MTLNQIKTRVQLRAKQCLPDVVERAFGKISNSHKKNIHKSGCGCSFCVFIRGEYTTAKILLAHANRKIMVFDEPEYWTRISNRIQKEITNLKGKSRELQNNIL